MANKFNQTKVQKLLKSFSDKDLRDLQVELTIEKRNREIRTATKYTVGQTVSFKATHGRQLSGTVIRVNKKTLSIQTPDSKWRVAYCYVG